ncbi:MAG TPA: CDP-alcohol phosphatidyltransferase family protein [Candidatus Limnocylindrales bacterium]
MTADRPGAASASLVSPALRDRVRGLAAPIARGLGRLGLSPNALTLIGFVGTCLGALAAANGRWLIAGLLILGFGIFDLFDGTLARQTGRATKLGAFLDSTFDRAGEGIVYVGIAAGSLGGGFSPGAILAASAMAAAFMVSYTRAKSESLGFASGTGMASVGLAPREVRIAILSIGLIWLGLIPTGLACDLVDPGTPTSCFAGGSLGETVLLGTLSLITVLATITTIQRILHVRAQSREG